MAFFSLVNKNMYIDVEKAFVLLCSHCDTASISLLSVQKCHPVQNGAAQLIQAMKLPVWYANWCVGEQRKHLTHTSTGIGLLDFSSGSTKRTPDMAYIGDKNY